MELYENITVPEATIIQHELRLKLDIRERTLPITTIAGADISLNLYSTTIYAGIVILSFPPTGTGCLFIGKSSNPFSLCSGLHGVQGSACVVKVWEQIPVKPSVLVVDGHGIAHPRRMGIAAHFGTLTGQTTMGLSLIHI